MSAHEAVRVFQAAQTDPTEQHLTALRSEMADTVEYTSLAGASAVGAEAALELVKDPQVVGFLASAQWSEPSFDGDTVSITARVTGGPIGGTTVRFTFAGELITSIRHERLPAPPAPVTELTLTDQIKEAINSALMTGNPMLIAYVRLDGAPSLSFRGSTHVWSETALAVWVRNPEGGLLAGLKENDHVTFWYRRPDPVMILQLWGRATVQNDDETREKVYAGMPEPEQRLDQQRRGIPVIVELDRIEGRIGRDPIRMVRNAPPP